MSVTTSSQLNGDKLQAALVALAGGAAFTSAGGALESPDAKVITPIGATDDQLNQAIAAAAGQYVDYAAQRATALSGLQTMVGEKGAWAQQGQADMAALQSATQPDWTILGPILARVVGGLLTTMQAHEDHLTVNGIIQ
jgi:hypothetical protein